MNNQQTCGKCSFHATRPEATINNIPVIECRKNAPKGNPVELKNSVIVSGDYWCGEFKPITKCQHETLKPKPTLNAYDCVEGIVCDKCGIAVMSDIYNKE